ncbi:hypothetical protein [Cupriavidus basilensis]|uniref:hypothetical protein n=1 Tax=Cupriavidus basilensis TaxID=68895 RepID=UPI00157B002E|nr:hypothetical protein [Cupriavidus basilensis]NUA30917.1 hypothetical protein [Cupriavidus basilensis]
MRTLKQALLATALAATLGGAASLASAAPRSVDPYLDGAATGQARDSDTQGANKLGPRDPFTDGARSGTRDPFTDGARNGTRDSFSDGA